MNIKISVDGRSFNKKGAGVCVMLVYERYKWKRTFTCGKLTTNQTEMKGIEYALKSILPSHEDIPVLIRTAGRYASMMLERTGEEWTKNVKSNAKLVESVRVEFLRFKEIKIEYAELPKLRKVNQEAVKTGQSIFVCGKE